MAEERVQRRLAAIPAAEFRRKFPGAFD